MSFVTYSSIINSNYSGQLFSYGNFCYAECRYDECHCTEFRCAFKLDLHTFIFDIICVNSPIIGRFARDSRKSHKDNTTT
jgi:hypothetical protein